MNVQRFSQREFIQLAGQATVGVITASLLSGCLAPVAVQEADINGVQLDVRVRGWGAVPVIFVHGAMGDECAAVVAEPVLTNQYRVIDYHRRGYGRSTLPEVEVSIAQQATDLRAVMDHLGVERAHMVGQSYGGLVVLQMALDHPDAVHSLALVEPALPSILSNAPGFLALGEKAGGLYGSGDKAGAMEAFGQEVGGTNFRTVFDQTLPSGWFERWVADADTIFQSDIAAMQAWQFTEEDATRITQPVLNVRGGDTTDYFREAYETIQVWLPQAENVIVPNSPHTVLQTAPKDAAEELVNFFARHQI
jgi:pimeloyl-ACP methyl ester carboxylesterase